MIVQQSHNTLKWRLKDFEKGRGPGPKLRVCGQFTLKVKFEMGVVWPHEHL